MEIPVKLSILNPVLYFNMLFDSSCVSEADPFHYASLLRHSQQKEAITGNRVFVEVGVQERWMLLCDPRSQNRVPSGVCVGVLCSSALFEGVGGIAREFVHKDGYSVGRQLLLSKSRKTTAKRMTVLIMAAFPLSDIQLSPRQTITA
ncbi:hypothetical protein PANDA_007920 [Ailuropoda melanoleuca]|uniref:Uncharacterized protein n=1 Tax=Ailuropoda melanoleuca TaxID=9646 RepID=D2HBL1_AILME|nr:hypothetical protein PANDA_007920 [Ailuropoda melanoleuca]